MEKDQESQLRARLGGKIPTRAEILKNQLNQRRFFDSGDYAMSKAGRKPEPGNEIGSEIPLPENIPHKTFLRNPEDSQVRRPSSLAQGSETVRVAASRRSPHSEDEAAVE